MHWHTNFNERQLKEISFSRMYVQHYAHGTDGHNAKMIIAKLADLMDVIEMQQEGAPKAKEDAPDRME